MYIKKIEHSYWIGTLFRSGGGGDVWITVFLIHSWNYLLLWSQASSSSVTPCSLQRWTMSSLFLPQRTEWPSSEARDWIHGADSCPGFASSRVFLQPMSPRRPREPASWKHAKKWHETHQVKMTEADDGYTVASVGASRTSVTSLCSLRTPWCSEMLQVTRFLPQRRSATATRLGFWVPLLLPSLKHKRYKNKWRKAIKIIKKYCLFDHPPESELEGLQYFSQEA